MHTTADLVGDQGTADGADEGDDVLHALEKQLGVEAADAGAGEHLGVVVGYGAVASPLTEECYCC